MVKRVQLSTSYDHSDAETIGWLEEGRVVESVQAHRLGDEMRVRTPEGWATVVHGEDTYMPL